jgi:hypothetical protein
MMFGQESAGDRFLSQEKKNKRKKRWRYAQRHSDRAAARSCSAKVMFASCLPQLLCVNCSSDVGIVLPLVRGKHITERIAVGLTFSCSFKDNKKKK